MTQRQKQLEAGINALEAKGYKLLFINKPSTKCLWTFESKNGDSKVLDAKELIAIGRVE